jgi:hypothetical protein
MVCPKGTSVGPFTLVMELVPSNEQGVSSIQDIKLNVIKANTK